MEAKRADQLADSLEQLVFKGEYEDGQRLDGRCAAVRMTDEALAQLADANDRCRTAGERADATGYYEENAAFHQLIYRGATNTFLQGETMRLQNRLQPYRRVQLRFRGRMSQSLAEHDAIVEALRAGDGELAANTLRSHVTVQGEKFQQLMASLKQ